MIRTFFDDLAHDLGARRDHWASRLRRRAWRVTAEGRTGAWRFSVTSLQRLHDLADHSPLDLGLVTVLERRLERVTDPGLEDYDDRTAKDIAKAVRDIDDPVRLARIAAWERAHKARKTVLGAIDKQQARIVPEVVPLPTREAPAPTDAASAA